MSKSCLYITGTKTTNGLQKCYRLNQTTLAIYFISPHKDYSYGLSVYILKYIYIFRKNIFFCFLVRWLKNNWPHFSVSGCWKKSIFAFGYTRFRSRVLAADQVSSIFSSLYLMEWIFISYIIRI